MSALFKYLYCTQMGLMEKARDAHLKGRSINLHAEDIIYNLASLYQTEGQRQEALVLLDEAILAGQENGILLKAKADQLLLWRRPDLAAPIYELALAKLSSYSLESRER